MSKKHRNHKPAQSAAGSERQPTAQAAGDTAASQAGEASDVDMVRVAAVAPAAAAVAMQGSPFDRPTTQTDIRGVLIQVAGAKLLLPNATIAEVLSYADPEPVGADAPQWLLGRMRWRGWHVPLIAFGTLSGLSEERGGLGSKVLVLKALGGKTKTPYVAILTQGFPRLVTVSESGLVFEDDASAEMPCAVHARVRLNEDQALVPDLEVVEDMVAEALAQAA